jgi:hypothetical protein
VKEFSRLEQNSADARTFMKQETAGRKALLIVFCSIWKNITAVVMHRREEID